MDADRTPTGQPTPASSTSLKWGSNGELSAVDLQRVLARLTEPGLMECSLADEPQSR
jgi:ABC-type hemin transport system ATPase subunit